MIPPPPEYTVTYTLLPDTTLFRSEEIERCLLAGNFKLPRSEIHEGRPVPDHIEQAVGGAGGAGAAERQVIGSTPHLGHGGRLARKAEDQIQRAIMIDAGRSHRVSYATVPECNHIGSVGPVGTQTPIQKALLK